MMPQPFSAAGPEHYGEIPAKYQGRPGAEGASILHSQLARIAQHADQIRPALEAYAQELPRGLQRRQVVELSQKLAEPNTLLDSIYLRNDAHRLARFACAVQPTVNPATLLRSLVPPQGQTTAVDSHAYGLFAYPAVVLSISCLILFFFANFIANSFRATFDEFDTVLPPATVLVLYISEAFQSRLGTVVLVTVPLVAITASIVIARRRHDRSSRFEAVSRFASSLADLRTAGVATIPAIRAASCVCDGRFRDAVNQLADAVQRSHDPEQSPGVRKLPATLAYAMYVQSPTAQIRLLRELAAAYRQTEKEKSHWLPALMEPLSIAFIGFFVGFAAIALVMPLVSLITNLSQ